jgi:hypothetical protein
MVLNATFNNISIISCRSDLLVEETGENIDLLSLKYNNGQIDYQQENM